MKSSVKLILALAMMIACFAIESAHSQVTQTKQDSNTITVSGGSFRLDNRVGHVTNAFEDVIQGAPSTVSVVIKGCMRGADALGLAATCDTLDTYTTVANSIRKPTISVAYDYFLVTASWTGGSSPSVAVFRMGTIARNGTGSGPGGGTWGSITGTLSSQSDLQTALDAKEAIANKDAASGYAGLTAGSLLKTAEFPAFTGDITTSAGSTATALKATGSAGTYQQVTTDAQGRVTAGVTRTVATSAPLGGGGALSSDLTLTCGTCALTSGTLAQFAATSSSLFFGNISDETGGSGLVVGNQSPTIVTPTIASFVNATHNHGNAAGGGTLAFGTALTDLSGAVVTSASSVTTVGKADVIQASDHCADAGSSGTAYTCNMAPAISAYTTGVTYWVKANTTNTAAATVAINGLAATTIKKHVGGVTTDVVANDIRAGAWLGLTYDGTNLQCGVGCDGNTPTASAAGVAGNIQANAIGGGGAIAAITDSFYDNNPTFAGTNSVVIGASRVWSNADNTHSGHVMEPTAKLTGSGIGNTLAGLYSTAIYAGSGGLLHGGASMHRGTDSGTGGTVTAFDLNYADFNSVGTAATLVSPYTKLVFYNAVGGALNGGTGNTYTQICGFCWTGMTVAGNTLVSLELGASFGVPALADTRKTSAAGVSIGGGADTNNYDALIVDSGMSYFKQAIKQSFTLDSTLQVAPITTGGITVSGITAAIYQSTFPTGAQSAANMNSLMTAANGITGSMYGNRQVTDNGGNGLVALLNPFYGKCGNSGGATTTTCEGATIDTPGNGSGGTLTNTIGLRVKTQASGTQTNTPFAIKTEGAADIVQIAGPARVKRAFANQGTATATGDIAISGGWGSTASKGSFTGFDQAGSFTITSAGTGQAANPTITFTFHDGTWTNAPVCQMWQNGGTGTIADLQNTTESATAPVFTYVGTPVASNTYRISWHCWGV